MSYEPKHAADPPVDCPDHRPVQHRDGKPPWCRTCGLTLDFETPVRIWLMEPKQQRKAPR